MSDLASSSAAEARVAEGRLATTQFRLRAEVMEPLAEALEAGAALRKPDEQARHYALHLARTRDHVERIASEHASSPGGCGVGPLESEVLVLRRELATAKMEVARLAGEKEELAHVAKQLNKQLAELAHRHR